MIISTPRQAFIWKLSCQATTFKRNGCGGKCHESAYALPYLYWFTLTICLKIPLCVWFRATWAFSNVHHVYGDEPTCCYVNKTILWVTCRVSEIFIRHNKYLVMYKKLELETTPLHSFMHAMVMVVVYCLRFTTIIYVHLKFINRMRAELLWPTDKTLYLYKNKCINMITQFCTVIEII